MDRKKRRAVLSIVTITATLLIGLNAPAAMAARAGNPQVFAGTVDAASGSPVAGAKVSLYATPMSTGKSVLVATAVTAASGKWSVAAPAYASLPKAVQSAVAANQGYLNVEVVAVYGASASLAAESAWVGTAASTRETGTVKPMAMRMALRSLAGTALAQRECCSPRDGCVSAETKVLGHSHSYTVVGEYHAYWDASGGLSYTRGAASSIGSYATISGESFTFQGYDTYSASNSLTMGFPSNGPYDSHQMEVSLDYVKTHWVMQNADTGKTCLAWNQIDEDGIYNPGHGWVVFQKGANVISHDGKAAYQWELRHHPAFINGIKADGAFTLDRGSALTYGAAADVFGVGIQAETTHSSDVAQEYTAGTSHARRHWVWGSNANITSNPHVGYSY